MKRALILLIGMLVVTAGLSGQSAGEAGGIYELTASPRVWLPLDSVQQDFALQSLQKAGWMFHLSDTLAIQPSFFAGLAIQENDSGGQRSMFASGIEVDVPLYTNHARNVSFFFAPGVRWLSAISISAPNAENFSGTNYTELGIRLKGGAQARFGNLAILSTGGVRIDYISTATGSDPNTVRNQGAGIGTTQFTIGLIYYGTEEEEETSAAEAE